MSDYSDGFNNLTLAQRQQMLREQMNSAAAQQQAAIQQKGQHTEAYHQQGMAASMGAMQFTPQQMGTSIPYPTPLPPTIAQTITQTIAGYTTGATEIEPDMNRLPAEHGYARLLGPDFTYTVRQKHIYLGRRMDVMKEGHVGISTAKNISRVHIEIEFIQNERDPDLGFWQLKVVSKNGMYCNETFRNVNEIFPLHHEDKIKVGETVFFFQEPIPLPTAVRYAPAR